MAEKKVGRPRIKEKKVGRPKIKRVGCPTKLTPELRRKILDNISSGKSLREICEGSDMPSTWNVNYWLREGKHPEAGKLREGMKLAKEVRLMGLENSLLEIAEGSIAEQIKDIKLKGRDLVGAVALVTKTKQWLLERLKKEYNKVEITETAEQEEIANRLSSIKGKNGDNGKK